MKITGIILAAGTSSRMSLGNKLLLKYKNHTVIEEVYTQLSQSRVDDIIIVCGYENERIEKQIKPHMNDKSFFILNLNFQLGRAESIKCAVKKVKDKSDALLFMVGDKPGINASLIDRAIEHFKKTGPPVLYVETPQGRGHPIIFSKRVFDDLLSLQGDRIGNDLINKYGNENVILNDDKFQGDIDNEYDYNKSLMIEAGESE